MLVAGRAVVAPERRVQVSEESRYLAAEVEAVEARGRQAMGQKAP